MDVTQMTSKEYANSLDQTLICKMYRAGMGGTSIAKYFGVSSSWIMTILERRGVKIRPKTLSKNQRVQGFIRGLAAAGLSAEMIAYRELMPLDRVKEALNE